MRYLLILSILTVIGGCGQKGPLVIPQQPQAPSSETPSNMQPSADGQ